MFTYASQPQPLFRVLRDAIRLYAQSFSRLWYWNLLWFLPLSLLAVPDKVMQNLTVANHISLDTIHAILLAATIIAAIIYLFGECFLLNRIHTIALSGELNFKNSLAVARNRIGPILVLYICSVILIFLGIFLLIALPPFTFGNFTAAPSFIRMILGFELPILIGTAVILAYCFWFLVLIITLLIVIDHSKIYQGLKHALTLVAANWWRTFFAIVLASLFLYVAGFIITSIEGLFVQSYIISVIGSLLLYTLFHSLFNSVLLVQFNDLKKRQVKII